MCPGILQKCCKVHVYASLLVSQNSLFTGFTHAYSAILLPQLQNADSSIVIDVIAASWIASLGTLCRPVGALIEGFLVDRYGRRTCIQISTAVHTCAWIFLSFAPDLFSIYLARIATSLATGMENSGGIYVTEISPTSQRGTLMSLMAPITSIGSLITYTLGSFLSWRLTAFIFGIYGLIILMLQLFIYESPVWYMVKNKKQQALKSLLWLRGNNKSEVKNELEDLEMKMNTYETDRMKFYLKNFINRSVWKPFIILLTFSILQKSTGRDAITAYAVEFFAIFKTQIDENVLSIVFAIISLMGSMNVLLIAHKFDRTTIIFFSGLGMSLSLAIGAIFFELNQSIATVCCVFLYIYCCMSGMMSVPYMIINESFPSHVRGVMGAAVSVSIFLPSSLIIKLYPTMVDILEPAGLLFCYSFFSLCAAVFSKLFILETRGKTLIEIGEHYGS